MKKRDGRGHNPCNNKWWPKYMGKHVAYNVVTPDSMATRGDTIHNIIAPRNRISCIRKIEVAMKSEKERKSNLRQTNIAQKLVLRDFM